MTIRRSKSALFLVEGDDECFLLGCIKRYGDVRKINLWESQNIIPKLTSTRQGVQEIFIIYLAQQTKAFEDEMVRGFSLRNRSELRSMFCASSDGEFKTKVMGISSPLDYLLRNGFHINALWCQPIIPELSVLPSEKRIEKEVNYGAFKSELIGR